MQHLIQMINHFISTIVIECLISTPLSNRDVRQVGKKIRINKDFKFREETGNYEMDDIILDLGSDMKILPKKTWELMGKVKLV